MEDTTIKDFESALAELEAIVKDLEHGSLTLERSLQLFERGVELSRYCHAQLDAAERRIEVLTEQGEPGPPPAALAAAAPQPDAGGKGENVDDGDMPF